MVTWATRNPLEIRLVESWTFFALILRGLNEIGRVSYLRRGGSLSNDSVIGKRGNSVREWCGITVPKIETVAKRKIPRED